MSSKGAADTQTQSTTVTGGNSNFVAASGSLGSSSLSAYAGPWYVETQTLNIEYIRVPNEQFWNNTCDATLSGLSTTHSNIQTTRLHVTYVASVEAKAVSANFTSSSVQQAQEFTVIAASGDPNGINYGALNASTLGPMGSIITSKPYIRRTPYTGVSSQPLFSKVSTGASFGVYDDTPNASSMVDGTTFMTDLNWWSQYGFDPIGNSSQRPEKHQGMNNIFTIPGAYNTSKELVSLDTTIDNVSDLISNEQMFSWPTPNADPISGFPDADEGLPEYDKNRHA